MSLTRRQPSLPLPNPKRLQEMLYCTHVVLTRRYSSTTASRYIRLVPGTAVVAEGQRVIIRPPSSHVTTAFQVSATGSERGTIACYSQQKHIDSAGRGPSRFVATLCTYIHDKQPQAAICSSSSPLTCSSLPLGARRLLLVYPSFQS